MAVDLRTEQEYLNAKLGTVGLTKQQCLQRLAGGIAPLDSNPMTTQDSAKYYAGAGAVDRGVQRSLNQKVGYPSGLTENDVQQLSISGSIPFGDNGTGQKLAQQFKPTKERLRTLVLQKRASSGTYTGDVTISIQGESATGTPNGSAIVTVTVPSATWEALTNNAEYAISFTAGLNPASFYWIVIESSTQNASNTGNLGAKTANPYTTGALRRWSGSSWDADVGTDLYFRTIVAVDDLFTEQEAARRL